MTDNVGAVNGANEPKKPVNPGMVTEHQAKKKINADPKQRPAEGNPETVSGEQAQVLLNDSFYNALGLKLTTFDEKTNESAVDKAKTSSDVLKLEIEKTERQRELLEEELPQIKIEHVKGWFDGTAALPGTAKYAGLDSKLDEVGESVGDVDGVVGKRDHTETKGKFQRALVEVDEAILFRMLKKSDYSDEQKTKLKEGLEKAYEMTMPELAREFGYDVKTDGLKDLTEDGTRADVDAQVAILAQMLEDMPTEQELDARIKELKDNIEAHIGTTNKDESRVGDLVKNKFKEQDIDEAERDSKSKRKLQKTENELAKLQEPDIDAYIEMKKLELLKGSIVKVREQVQKLHDKLKGASDELKQMEDFEVAANEKRDQLLKTEGQDYKAKVKDVRDKRIASENAAVDVVKAERKDKKKGVYTQQVETDTKKGVVDKQKAREAALKAEQTAMEQKRKAGFAKNTSHVYRYIDDLFENKKIDKATKDKLKAALEAYKDADADKLELIADWIKFDDQSTTAIRKKAKAKVNTETKTEGIQADDLLYLLENVKGMKLKLDTAKEKVEAKEKIAELLNKKPKAEEEVK